MHDYRHEFIRLALARNALRFGEFTLKSGRVSPYFFNAGAFDDGASLAALGRCYAAAIVASSPAFDMLFGPAYKGIPLVTATAAAMHTEHARNLPYAFNRKEAKTHGEGGSIVGRPLAGRVLIVDDVITAGTAANESLDLIGRHGARAAGVVISLDRQEQGRGDKSAIQEIEATHGIPVISIVNLSDLLEYIGSSDELKTHAGSVERYRREYGV
jgi:orotate phosphoribosyltransferase